MLALPGVFEHNYAISILPQAIAFPLFPLFASPLSSTFSPHFASFSEYLNPVTLPIFLSHVLTGKSVGIVSGGRR